VLIVGGLGTSAAFIDAFAPQLAVKNIAGLGFIQEYTIFVQHWGIMVGLMGVMMVAAAFRPSWVMPILVYSVLEKVFMVYLAFSNIGQASAAGFMVPATIDSVIILYALAYFWSLHKA